MTEERLQKILAQAGFGSRRSCEQIILDGRVKVNGKQAGLGDKADLAEDEIRVDGQLLTKAENKVYILLNKPRNVLSTVTAPDVRRTVRDLVDVKENVFPVGRLDVDSEGLVFLTNDGDLANLLTHPRYEHEKEYEVLVASIPDQAQLGLWRRGVVLADGSRTRPAEVSMRAKHGKGAWLKVTLKEGKKRQIREMGRTTGLPVVRIVRVRIANLVLGNLKPGEWRHLTPEEVATLKNFTSNPKEKTQTLKKNPIARRRG